MCCSIWPANSAFQSLNDHAGLQVLKVCEGNILKLGEGMEVELRALEGEEETKFLETAQQNISARRNKGKQQHGRGRRGGRGGRGGGRGFGRGELDNYRSFHLSASSFSYVRSSRVVSTQRAPGDYPS